MRRLNRTKKLRKRELEMSYVRNHIPQTCCLSTEELDWLLCQVNIHQHGSHSTNSSGTPISSLHNSSETFGQKLYVLGFEVSNLQTCKFLNGHYESEISHMLVPVIQNLFQLWKHYRVYSLFKMWTVHFFTFHQPHDFLSSGSTGWPSMGTGLSKTFKKRTIHALKTFGSKSCLGISNWKINDKEICESQQKYFFI